MRTTVLPAILVFLVHPALAEVTAAEGLAPSLPRGGENVSTERDGILYVVVARRKCGYVDRGGNLIIPVRYNAALSFGADGFAQVYHGTRREIDDTILGQPAVINRKGQIVVEGGTLLGQGCVAVREENGLRFTKVAGRFSTDLRCTNVRGTFSEGLLAVKIRGKWGFMDELGKLAIPAVYETVEPFAEGVALAVREDKKSYIDHRGEWIVQDPSITARLSFCEGLAQVLVNGRPSYMDHAGKPAIQLDLESRARFSEGLAAVREPGSTLHGYIGHDGRYRIAPKFRQAAPFSEGLAYAQLPDGKCGFIDHSGEFAIGLPAGASHANAFCNGLAFVWLKERQGLIDRSGAWVWSTTEID